MFLTIVYLLALIFYVLCTIFWGEDFNWDVGKFNRWKVSPSNQRAPPKPPVSLFQTLARITAPTKTTYTTKYQQYALG